MNRVFVVGFMGAGKSSVGRALSRRLGFEFEDLDERIRAREGRTIEAIFRESGEAEFRRVEHAALRDLLSSLTSSRIIALGGGAFAQAENAALLEQAGVHTVFLDAPAEELWRRCQQEPATRPLRKDKRQFQELYEARRPCYLRASLCIDTTGKEVDSIAEEVASRLGFSTS